MKKIFISLLFISKILAGQTLNSNECISLIKDPRAYVFNNSDRLNSNETLDAMGSCYLSSEDYSQWAKNFSIPKSLRPGLILLIKYSDSMNDSERQYWFNLADIMREDQLSKLQSILVKERFKLIEIERKYGTNTKESKTEKYIYSTNKSDGNLTDLLFLGMYRNRIGIVKPHGENIYIDYFYKDTIKSSSLKLITPKDSHLKISIGRSEDYDKYHKDFSEILLRLDSHIWESYIKHKPDYASAWFLSILDNHRKLTITDSEMQKFLTLSSSFSKSKNYPEIQSSILYIKHNNSLLTEDYDKSLEHLAKRLSSGFMELTSINRFAFLMTELPTYENIESQRTTYNNIISIIETQFRQSKDKLKSTRASTEYMMLDYANFLCKNSTIRTITSKLKDDFKESAMNTGFEDSWYSHLHTQYISKQFQNNWFTQDIIEHVTEFVSKNGLKRSINSYLSEYMTFYVLFQLKYTDIPDLDRLKQITSFIKNLFNDKTTDYYTYVENYMSKRLHDEIEILKSRLKRNRQKYALIVGVSDYERLQSSESTPSNLIDLFDLKYASKDALDISKVLDQGYFIDSNWNKTILTNHEATTTNIKKHVKRIFTQARKDDIILIFFSGHAKYDYLNDLYLLGYNYDISNIEENVSREWIDKNMISSKSQNVFMFLDACYSGASNVTLNARGSGDNYTKLLEKEMKKYGGQKFIFASSGANQESFESKELANGLFTHFLIRGLMGEAPETRNNQYIDLDELETFVINQVSRYSEKNSLKLQVPRIIKSTNDLSYPITLRK